MELQINNNYSNAIQLIKNAILKSRYRAAALANRELLSLYYGIGKYISDNSRNHFWGPMLLKPFRNNCTTGVARITRFFGR